MSLLSGCSMARAGSRGGHGTDWGRDLPSVRSRDGPGMVTGHTKNYSHMSHRSEFNPEFLRTTLGVNINDHRVEMHWNRKNEATRKALSVPLSILFTALSLC